MPPRCAANSRRCRASFLWKVSRASPSPANTLSFWDSEDAIAHWRQEPGHRKVQAAGRAGIFSNYRLRIASVVRDYGLNERAQAPADSLAAHGASSGIPSGAPSGAPSGD